MPRGAGASAAAVLLLASTCYGVVKGGHTQAIVAQIQDICDTAANGVGFRVTEVALAGDTKSAARIFWRSPASPAGPRFCFSMPADAPRGC